MVSFFYFTSLLLESHISHFLLNFCSFSLHFYHLSLLYNNCPCRISPSGEDQRNKNEPTIIQEGPCRRRSNERKGVLQGFGGNPILVDYWKWMEVVGRYLFSPFFL